jgi:hypothetical protein
MSAPLPAGEVQVFDAFAHLTTPGRLARQVCHELCGYRPTVKEWHDEVAYMQYGQLCR